MPITIDAHQHFWKLSQPFDYRWLDAPELAAIRRDRMPEDLAPQLAAAGVGQSIFVQTQHNVEETRWVLGLAEAHPFLAGVVGWVDLASEGCEAQLLELARHKKFVGVRHVTQDEPDDDFIVRPEVLRGLKVLEKHGVPFDLLFYPKHLHHAVTLARELPELPMVLDHLAKPPIKQGSLKQRIDDRWRADLQAAAQYPNIYCKLSGLVTEADWQNWTPAQLRPYIELALELFGPQRCMYGSDWPVCELAGSYAEVHAALAENIQSLSADEQTQVWGETARRFYRLPAAGR